MVEGDRGVDGEAEASSFFMSKEDFKLSIQVMRFRTGTGP
jgi:hypothetical protein